ncbi:DNA glycosylase [Trichodelitschia bisporula]|uniref:DNA glycosylase n=1 Tax=Trichodelitschia bisporula TaxID=703511 RepID=A0A6G1I063_9PEZI|nr:DNA glycosylase [Trichodelitschia bisporula]
MPRTRAMKRVDDGNNDTEARGPDHTASSADISPTSAVPSFNGKLQAFEYTAATGTASRASISQMVATSVTTTSRALVASPLKKPAKRAAASPASTASPAKKKRESSKYAPPSKYAHLSPLTDILEPGLLLVFVGFNPGVRTATMGHAYAHPSNAFWRLLHSSGLTDRRCRPEEDVDLPRLYSYGNTNIISRPTRDAAELSKDEMLEGALELQRKMRAIKPEVVCIVGKSIWESIWQQRWGKKPTKKEFSYGWQDERHNIGTLEIEKGDEDADWPGSKVFVATSTSGLSAYPKPAEKEAIWKPLGEWAQQRRRERAETAAAVGAADAGAGEEASVAIAAASLEARTEVEEKEA